MEIKQEHVISSSEGEKKKRRVGEGEESSEQRGRRDGGNHGYKAGMEEKMMHSEGRSGMSSGIIDTDRLPAVDELLLLWLGVETRSSQTRRICGSACLLCKTHR